LGESKKKLYHEMPCDPIVYGLPPKPKNIDLDWSRDELDPVDVKEMAEREEIEDGIAWREPELDAIDTKLILELVICRIVETLVEDLTARGLLTRDEDGWKQGRAEREFLK